MEWKRKIGQFSLIFSATKQIANLRTVLFSKSLRWIYQRNKVKFESVPPPFPESEAFLRLHLRRRGQNRTVRSRKPSIEVLTDRFIGVDLRDWLRRERVIDGGERGVVVVVIVVVEDRWINGQVLEWVRVGEMSYGERGESLGGFDYWVVWSVSFSESMSFLFDVIDGGWWLGVGDFRFVLSL